MLSMMLVPAGALAVTPTSPGTVTLTDPVNATITRTDTLDEVTFNIEILSDNPAGHVYGVGLVFATSTDQPAFQVWYAEAGAAQGAPGVGWWYQAYGAGWEACETLEASGTGITAIGDGASGEKVFTVAIPTAELGGPGATYYYAIQVRTNLIGWYPAAYNWGPDVSGFAEATIPVNTGVGLTAELDQIVAINVSPTSIDFGTITPGTPSSLVNIDVTNIGTVTADVEAGLLTMSNAPTVFQYLKIGGKLPNAMNRWLDIFPSSIEPSVTKTKTAGLDVPVTYSARGAETVQLVFIATPATP